MNSVRLAALVGLVCLVTCSATRHDDSLFSCETCGGRYANSLLGWPCGGAVPGGGTRLRAVVASWGRSGSASLRLALEQMGLRPLHGSDLLNIPEVAETVMHHDPMALLNATERLGYDVGLETHHWAAPDIARARPDAKVLVMRRDTYRHARSLHRFNEIAFKWGSGVVRNWPLKLFVAQSFDTVETVFSRPFTMEQWHCLIGRTCDFAADADRQISIVFDMLRAHDERLSDVLPPDQVVEFRVGIDGYPELCAALGVSAADCPQGPYPHVNRAAELEALASLLWAINQGLRGALALVGALAAWGACDCYRRFGAWRRARGEPGATKKDL